MKIRFLVLLVVTFVLTPVLGAQCTLTLSEEGIVRIKSGQERKLTWNSVPGASSYLVEELIEGINEPEPPDFTFGGPYTESHNFEGRGITQFIVGHAVTYKIRYRYTVSALKREDASWQPCKDSVLFVIEPDPALAELASLRIIPLAGKTPGRNGSRYSTALVLAGTGLGPSPNDPPSPPRPNGEVDPPYDELPKLYQGRIYFRPLGTPSSDDDPFVEYALGGDETLVFDDIMDRLGASGIGSLEVRPKIGYPTPLADAVIENHLPDGKRVGVRVPGVLARHALHWADSATVGIRNMNDTRIAFGVRSLGGGGRVFFQHLGANGRRIDTAERFIQGEMTMTYDVGSLFASPLKSGDRIVAGYQGFGHFQFADEEPTRAVSGPIFFLTETGNDLDNPSVVSREPLADPFYLDGYDRFVVY